MFVIPNFACKITKKKPYTQGFIKIFIKLPQYIDFFGSSSDGGV